MFRFHETTRRRVVRTALVLLCAIPTASVAVWVCYARRPWRLADEQARLGAALQMAVTLSDWQTPRPGVVQIQRLALAEPGGARLADLAGVTIDSRGDALAIHADSATVFARQLPALAARLPTWATNADGPAAGLHIDALAVRHDEYPAAFELHDVGVRIERTVDRSLAARLLGRYGDALEKGAVRVQWERPATNDSPADRIAIDAQQAPLPTWLIAAAAPPLAAGGADAAFSGLVQIDVNGSRREGIARGALNGIDLAAMLPSGSPHQVQGAVDATLTELRFRDNQVATLTATVRGANVQASRSLLDAATRHLLCPAVGIAGDSATLDRIACKIRLDRSGLTLTGDFPPDAPLPAGCLAEAGGRPVLMQPAYVELPAGAWVQTIAAPGASWVPATQEAVDMAERLPLPASSPGSTK